MKNISFVITLCYSAVLIAPASASQYSDKAYVQKIEENILKEDFRGAISLSDEFLAGHRKSRYADRIQYLKDISQKKMENTRTPVSNTVRPQYENRYQSGDSAYYIVQMGAFKNAANANKLAKELQGKGFETSIATAGTGSGKLYKLRLGKFKDSRNAGELVSALNAKGYSPEIINE